jgi:hypothetical protein
VVGILFALIVLSFACFAVGGFLVFGLPAVFFVTGTFFAWTAVILRKGMTGE